MSNVNEKMTALADAIRSKTEETQKPGLDDMIESIELVYEKGKAEGDGDDSLLRSVIDRSVTEIVIPEGTTKIGNYCFLQCFSLKKITIPNTVTHIGGYALGINALSSLELPDSVIEIGNSAIYSCSQLKSITFGQGLSTIVTNNFNDLPLCTLYDFTRCTQVPTLGGTSCFRNINAEARILVPAHLYSDWIEATNWSQHADYIVAAE